MKCEFCGKETKRRYPKYFPYKLGYREFVELLKVCEVCLYSDQKKVEVDIKKEIQKGFLDGRMEAEKT
jgi:hypothetical protein